MLDITKDIQSLTTFRRRSGDFLKQLKKSKRPVVLTVKGKAAAIVQDAEAYQRLLDIAASADAEEGIRQGLDDVANGRTRPARAAFDEIRRKHGIQNYQPPNGRSSEGLCGVRSSAPPAVITMSSSKRTPNSPGT
jgi:prevent-host-death family protein